MSWADAVQLERRGFFGDLWQGARAVASGLAFVVTSKGGLRTALTPAAIAVGLWLVLEGLGAWASVALSQWLFPPGGTIAAVSRAVAAIVLVAVSLFVSGVIALALAQPLSRGALDRLASRLSQSVGAPEPQLPSSHVFASLRTALGALGFAVPGIGLIELVTAAAPEAAFLTEPLALVVTGLAFAWDVLDHPMSRRGMSWRERLRWMRENAALLLGFSLATQALLLVPVVDLFALPIGVLGATKLLASRAPSSPPPARLPRPLE